MLSTYFYSFCFLSSLNTVPCGLDMSGRDCHLLALLLGPSVEQARSKSMETFYWAVFGGLLAAVIALQISNRSAAKLQTSDAFKAFKNNYLVVYCLMMGGCDPNI